jgi:hypothetical protein
MKHVTLLVLILFSPLIIANDPESLEKQLLKEKQRLCDSNTILENRLLACAFMGSMCNALESHCPNNTLASWTARCLLAFIGGTCYCVETEGFMKTGINHFFINKNRATLLGLEYEKCKKASHALGDLKKSIAEENKKLLRINQDREILAIIGFAAASLSASIAYKYNDNPWIHVPLSMLSKACMNLGTQDIFTIAANYHRIRANRSEILWRIEGLTQ